MKVLESTILIPENIYYFSFLRFSPTKDISDLLKEIITVCYEDKPLIIGPMNTGYAQGE